MAVGTVSLTSDISANVASAAAKTASNARGRDSSFTLPDDSQASAPQNDNGSAAAPPATADNTSASANAQNQGPAGGGGSQPGVADAPASGGKADGTAKKDKNAKDRTSGTDAKGTVIPLGATAGTGSDIAQAVAAAAAATQPGGTAPNPATTKPGNLVVGASAATANAVTALGAPGQQPAAAGAQAKAETTDKAGKHEAEGAAAKASLAPATETTTEDKPKTAAAQAEAIAKAIDPTTHQATAQAAAADASLAVTQSQTGQTQGTAAASAPQTATPTLQPTPLQTVPIEIGMQALRNGSSTFDIRLDPAELGKVQVKLKISDGNVSASLVVDRVETLQMLQRESKTLEQAFEQAGLKSNPDGLQFSLRRDNGEGSGSGGQQQQGQSQSGNAETPDLPANVAVQRIMQSSRYSTGLDIQI